MKVTLHRTGAMAYETDYNGHHYEVWKDSKEQEVWCVTCDGEFRDGSYFLRDIRGSIECGDLEVA